MTACKQLFILHAVPLAIGGYLTISFFARLHIAGGHETPITLVIGQTAAMMLGAAETNNLVMAPTTLAALALFIAGIWWLRRIADDIWVFFAIAIVMAPALLLVVWQPEYLYERYLLLPMMFLLMLIAAMLGRLMVSHGWRARFASCAALAVIIAANVWQMVNLIRFGRGDYSGAIAFMVAHMPAEQAITIASDHDARNKPLVQYHSRHAQRPVDYLESANGAPPPTLWYIVHRFHDDPPAQESLTFGGDRTYALIRSFDYASLSGWQWLVYRQVAGEKDGEDPP